MSRPNNINENPDLIRDLSPPTEIEITIDHCPQTVFYDHASAPWNDLAELTYCESHDAYPRLMRSFEEVVHTEKNVLLVGDSGFGKSTLLSKVLYDLDGNEPFGLSICCACLNLRKLGIASDGRRFYTEINTILLRILKHFCINPAPGVETAVETPETFFNLSRLLRNESVESLRKARKAAVLIVDDIDYLERVWHPVVLEQVSDLLQSTNVTVVWACRPPALMELEYEFSQKAKSHFVELDPIDLPMPDIRRVVLIRLWPFLDPGQCPPDVGCELQNIRQSPRYSRFKDVILREGRKALRDLQPDRKVRVKTASLPYPLGPRQEHFVRQASNGDIRIAFGMVASIVAGINKRREEYRAGVDDGGNPVPPDIGRTAIFEMLGMKDGARNPQLPEQERELWRVLNLFERTDKTGRIPLHVNVLEWVALSDGRFDENFLKAMDELGFTKQEAHDGAEFCRNARLIEPEVIRTGRWLLGSSLPYEKWQWILTGKGSFYLWDVITWPQYAYARGFVPFPRILDRALEMKLGCDLLEVLAHLVESDYAIRDAVRRRLPRFGGKKGYLLMAFSTVYDFFREVFGANYRIARRPSRDSVEYIDTVSKDVVRSALAARRPGKKDALSDLVIIRDDGCELKRQAIRSAYQRRRLVVPNRARFDLAGCLRTVFEKVWEEKLHDHMTKAKVSREELLEDAMRILRDRRPMPFELA